jgi:probable HAF family extracellular repeat protein
MRPPSALPALVVAALALFANTLPVRAAETSYAITDLGSLGGSSVATAINASGQIVGYSYPATGSPHAFLWSNGVMTDLGTPASSDYSVATGINASAQVVGYSVIPSFRALVFEGGTVADVGAPGVTPGIAEALNDAGEIVGWFRSDATGLDHAFHYSAGTLTDLGAFDGFQSLATGINASGQIAVSTVTYDGQHAFLYENGSATNLGDLGFGFAQSASINASGQVTGYSVTADFQTHAFRYQGGAMADLGALAGGHSFGEGINAAGDVVGVSYTADFRLHAFLYRNGAMLDLNDMLPAGSGWELVNASAINDRGDIVGWGNRDGVSGQRAFLLSPRTPAQQIDDLIVRVRGFQLSPKGIENAFIVKLQHANEALAAGDIGGACADLGAFVSQTQAQSGKKLTVAQAEEMVAAARAIQSLLGCS